MFCRPETGYLHCKTKYVSLLCVLAVVFLPLCSHIIVLRFLDS